MKPNPKIKVVGVGGSGSNTISRMVKDSIQGIDLIAVNTDAQALRFCKAERKVLIGENVTRGLGAGMDVSLGRKAAEESKEKIKELLKEANMVFITCGMGGGTGSGASPIIAEVSKSLGILTIAVVTRPFSFEGEQRRKVANSAIEQLKDRVDALLVISNDKLLHLVDNKTTVSNAFWICDEVLREAVQGITDLVVLPGIVTVDMASILAIMKNAGTALFGVGKAKGENRAVEAAQKAINSPLLDSSISGAKRVLFNVSGQDLGLAEISEVAKIITKTADKKAQVIFGAINDENLKKGEIKVTVIAAGF
ncbi:cell division protein FtsZ [Patescibacteria group bacterium]|nr:cell division protein FtsZ [Patescibacteria group bacterium]MBU4367408.1 cell division protein FtsZ [Patescibacteria group bacterium]MBU4461728.1 cell division protein FtsZ [Patescibacteria group bacterium]MCG2700112.1 cell division protein FtsZ [Candidatus Parcubacteria bacterium]